MNKGYELEEDLSLTYGGPTLRLHVISGTRTQPSSLVFVAQDLFTDPEDAVAFKLEEPDVLDLIGHLILAYAKMRK